MFTGGVLGLQNFLFSVCDQPLQQRLAQLSIQQLESLVQDDLRKFVSDALQNQEEELSALQELLLKTHTLYTDIHSSREILWNMGERRVSDWTPTAYLKKFPIGIKTKLTMNAPLAKIVFSPFHGTQTTWQDISEGHTVTCCNTYKPPVWYDRDLNPADFHGKQENYPQLFTYLLSNLFPYPQEQQTVLDWLALATFDRPDAILTLRGNRGNGKTQFKHIIYHLVGNFLEAQDRIFGDFNAELRNKRIIGIDDNERIGTIHGHNLRKRLTNPTITLNEKHIQTEVTEKQFASFIICSNSDKQHYVEYDERKIVSVWTTPHNMQTWPQMAQPIFDWIKPFLEVDTNKFTPGHTEFLRQVGLALFTRLCNKSIPVSLEYHSGTFWLDVIASLPSFKRYIVEQVFSGEFDTLEYEVLKADFAADNARGNIPHWHTLSRWLSSNFNLYGAPLTTDVDNKTKSFTPNPWFKQIK